MVQKRNLKSHIITVMILAVFIALGLASASTPSIKESNGFKYIVLNRTCHLIGYEGT